MDIHEQIKQAKRVLNKLVVEDWKSELFSPAWLGIIAFILLSYYICFRLLDKRRLTQLLLYGSLMTVSMTVIDIFGTQFGFWTFLTRVMPIVPSVLFFDYTIIPLYYMLVYQYSSTWRSFAAWNAVLAGIISFIFFPLLTALKLFKLYNWRYIYFFPLIYILAFICIGVVWGIVSVQNKKMES
jgi:hypothetical protein